MRRLVKFDLLVETIPSDVTRLLTM